MADGEHVRGQLVAALREVGDNTFESELRGCIVHFPADCWENARCAGLTFGEVLGKVHAHVFAVLDALIEYAGLSWLRISSLYRATGGGPHTTGCGVDLTAISTTPRTQGEPDWVRFLREADDVAEPELARRVRRWLWEHKLVSQVLGPWFMCSTGSGVRPNRARSNLEKQHRNHLHLTVKH